MSELDDATLKLYMTHNKYTLALVTARQYHQWLVTRLRPCLYRNLNRCLRLADYGIAYLLRLARADHRGATRNGFDLVPPPESDPLGDLTDADGLGELSGIGPSVGEDTFRRAFPFDLDLILRAGDDSLQPDKIIVNPITFYDVQAL